MTSKVGSHSTLSFLVTSKTWHELGDKILQLHQPMRTLLNEHVNLANYGTGVEQVRFIFVADIDSAQAFHEDYLQFNHQTKQLTIQYNLDYFEVLEQSNISLKNLLAISYLDGVKQLDKIYETVQIDEFNLLLFINDLEHLFKQHKWLI